MRGSSASPSRACLTAADGLLHGTVRGIGEGGELLLETPDGLRKLVQADEVRVTG